MFKPELCLIACLDRENNIGKDNKLPWHIPEDLAYFKKNTVGSTVVMGNNTLKSLPSNFSKNGLPLRRNIVLTRNKDLLETNNHGSDIIYKNSVDYVLDFYKNSYYSLYREKIWIIGGRSVYEQFIPHADKLYLTRIKNFTTEDADSKFPTIDRNIWELVGSSEQKISTYNIPGTQTKYVYQFEIYQNETKDQA